MLKRRRWIKIALFVALPLVIYLIIAERWSWRPRTIPVSAAALAWSPDSRTLAVVAKGQVHIIDSRNKAILRRIDTGFRKDLSYYELTFSPDGSRIALGAEEREGWSSEELNGVKIWDISSGRLLQQFRGMSLLHFDGSTFTGWTLKPSDTTHGTAQIVTSNINTRRVVRSVILAIPPRLQMHLPHVIISHSHHGRFVATVFTKLAGTNKATYRYEDLGLQLFNAETGRLYRELLPVSSSVASEVVFAHDDQNVAVVTLSSSGKCTIHIWHVADKMQATQLDAGTRYFANIEFSPDGTQLATAEDQGKNIMIWDIRRRKITRSLSGGTNVSLLAFAPDGHTLAGITSNGTVKLWRIK
ncbi:MAG: hypothetical protein M3347_03460 [Armatimonadota bacterium]|nr:hypothetical protein [Armatimonadota bacterium]